VTLLCACAAVVAQAAARMANVVCFFFMLEDLLACS
jgi:hypothetical protein